ncbi:MAG: VCBS repeat-containing protein [Akkermansiaceae bacterium]|nr:VCBS repeat-containing protein [Akkermansiaceae bacterium]
MNPRASLLTAFLVPTSLLGDDVVFEKTQIDTAFRSEGVAVADFTGDGKPDLVAGNVLYVAPDWKMYALRKEKLEFPRKGYSDAFLCFADDLDADGDQDAIVVGFPGRQTRWYQNPGRPDGAWKSHLAVQSTPTENPDYLDLDGDGKRELIYGSTMAMVARPGKDPTRIWKQTAIGSQGRGSGHGLGVGDVNSDGRLDVVSPHGWWEQPADRKLGNWPFHDVHIAGGAQILVQDFDGDGKSDVLSSEPHRYGIWWLRQGAGDWRRHELDRSFSQPHAVHRADIDGDGLADFVTGKRYWAHNGNDPGAAEPAVLCWFQLQRKDGKASWKKHEIDNDSGVGLQFAITDLNGDSLPDIVTSNKKGVFVFVQKRR